MTVLLNKLPHDTRSNRDPIRTDLANIALNEKRIKIGPNHSDAERKYIVFANQLLQIPGITEKVAMAIAEKFQTPTGLLQFIDKGNSLEGFTFMNSKHEVKKYVNIRPLERVFLRVNCRIRSVLEKTFSDSVDPDSSIW